MRSTILRASAALAVLAVWLGAGPLSPALADPATDTIKSTPSVPTPAAPGTQPTPPGPGGTTTPKTPAPAKPAPAKPAPVPQPAPTAGGTPGGVEPADADSDGKGDAEVVAGLGGTSPFCKRPGLDAETISYCKRTNSIARPYPLNSYGLDNNVDVGLKKVGNFFPSAIQWLVVIIWQVLLQGFTGVLLLLEWSFSIDLVNRSLAGIRVELIRFSDEVLGPAWMLAGISIAGLWGIWNGLVRRRSLETLGGLASVVGLMCVALLIIHQPGNTVGRVSSFANEGSLDALSLVSGGTLDDPSRSYAESNRQLFDAIVVRPWCAMQFGDVGYCLERPKKICTKDDDALIGGNDVKCREFPGTVADAWLEHPARSEERKKLFNYLNDKDPGKVRLQDVGGTGSRVGLLVLVLVGSTGALLLLGYLGGKLVYAAVATLVLVLAAPVVLILPAFGETGRKGFLIWFKRLFGAALAKLLYSFFLAVVILIASIIAGLDGLGWYGKWMILIVFWWGVLIKRNDFVGFVLPADSRAGSALSSIYYGRRLAGEATRAVTALPRGVARAGTSGARRVRDRVGSRRRARDGALQRDAQRQRERIEKGEVGPNDVVRPRGQLDAVRRQSKGTERDLRKARRRKGRLQTRADRTEWRSSESKRERVGARLQNADREVTELQQRSDALRAERARIERSASEPQGQDTGGGAPTAGTGGTGTREVAAWDRELSARADGDRLSRGARRAAKREVRVDPKRRREVKRGASAQRRKDAGERRRRGGMGRR